MELENLIIDELKTVNDKLDHLMQRSEQRLTELETKIDPLFDNGQLGRCSRHQRRLDDVEGKLTLQRGRAMTRRSMFLIITTICTLLAGMTGAGAMLYDTLHKQSQQLQTSMVNVQDQLSEHQNTTGEKIVDLQKRLDEANAQLALKNKQIQNDIDTVSRQVYGVDSRVKGLSNDFNRPKTHWYNNK